MIRAVDMGFHPAVASYLWATTMPEILDLFAKKTEYFPDLAFVNSIDPKMSYPYAFSVLTLPAIPAAADSSTISEADAIGKKGLADADPDWRIPYYMATNEYLYAKNEALALSYYDIAARTPGIPQFAERFALNFSIGTNGRQKAEDLWASIRDTTNDQFSKDRAQAYIDRLQDFDMLDAASKEYKNKFGTYPPSPAELVQKGIISAIPVDPFGFTFIIKPDGTSAIDLNILPSYLTSHPVK
jgi:hypothetical protein